MQFRHDEESSFIDLRGRTGMAGPSLFPPPARVHPPIQTKVVGTGKVTRRRDIGHGHLLSSGAGQVGTMKGVYSLYKKINSNGSPSEVLEMTFFKYTSKRTDSVLFCLEDLIESYKLYVKLKREVRNVKTNCI